MLGQWECQGEPVLLVAKVAVEAVVVMEERDVLDYAMGTVGMVVLLALLAQQVHMVAVAEAVRYV